MKEITKPLEWLGDSKERMKSFPSDVQDNAGYELWLVQVGKIPANWKVIKTVGTGVKEIRVKDEGGQFRVIYLATRPEAVYILHTFQKKTQKTSKRDIELARQRFKEIGK